MVNMRKFLLAPILSVVMVATVILGANFFMKPEPAKADSVEVAASCNQVDLVGLVCARQVGDSLVISLAGADVATLPLSSVVSIPTVKVTLPETIRVTLPRVTVTRPPVTITLPRVTLPSVTVPGPVVTLPRQTVTVELPGATRTATLPGQTTTVPGQRVTPAPTVVPVTITQPNGQRIQTSVTITPSPEPGPVTTKPVVKEKEVRVSVPQAIAYGIGALLIGLLLGLLAIYTAYAVGYKDSEDAEKTRWQNFRDDLFGKKDEGEN
jgi:hypothetical protein